MKFKDIVESKRLPKYTVINFVPEKNDITSVINRLKKEFPEQKIGIRNGFIHFNSKEVFDLRNKPLDINLIKNTIKNLTDDGNN